MIRLSPIYACDVFSFLPYSQLQQSRLVSRSLNNTILEERYVQEDGYWTNSTMESHAENWKHLQEEWGCCSELESDASPLVGECIVPLRPAGGLLDIQIWNSSGSIIFRSRNEMTTATAFGLLHLFHHLRGAAVGQMSQYHVLNPSLFQILSEEAHYHLHVLFYSFDVNPPTVEVHVGNFAHISTKMLASWVENPMVGLDFALRGRPYCKELRVSTHRENFYDIALQHFQAILPVIGRHVVSELLLRINFRTHPIPWPAGLLPKEEMEPLGQGRYRQRGLTNINSGERFDVEVVYEAQGLGIFVDGGVDTVRLIFREGK